jgi:hypothetical protein
LSNDDFDQDVDSYTFAPFEWGTKLPDNTTRYSPPRKFPMTEKKPTLEVSPRHMNTQPVRQRPTPVIPPLAFKEPLKEPLETLSDIGNSSPRKDTDNISSISNQLSVQQMDQMNELVNLNLFSMGFPEAGNLRSTKRKDVMKRLKCIQ